jgi:spore maturation protein CgeB
MSHRLRIAYFAHSLRSDWNNGNAHFLRGLIRSLGALHHDVIVFEPRDAWSFHNLQSENCSHEAVMQFTNLFPDLHITDYDSNRIAERFFWRETLKQTDVVILHEWNDPKVAHMLLSIRDQSGFKLLFHDTHHRATSSPEQIRMFGIQDFDGVLAFGEVLHRIYRNRFGISNVWTLHEAADTSVFQPRPNISYLQDVVWIGNWGDEERSAEICEFLLQPAKELREILFTVYGVRYPEEGLRALQASGVRYGGYLPNLQAPCAYASSRLTVHIPRKQYSAEMPGIPTIRVFEALACGIPLISAPWRDEEGLFRKEDIWFVSDRNEMLYAIKYLLAHPKDASQQAQSGLDTILSQHTCMHRAEQLTSICQEILH